MWDGATTPREATGGNAVVCVCVLQGFPEGTSWVGQVARECLREAAMAAVCAGGQLWTPLWMVIVLLPGSLALALFLLQAGSVLLLLLLCSCCAG